MAGQGANLIRPGSGGKVTGARDPDRLGEQLALLYDGAAARSVALNTPDTARQIAETLLDNELPTPRTSARAGR